MTKCYSYSIHTKLSWCLSYNYVCVLVDCYHWNLQKRVSQYMKVITCVVVRGIEDTCWAQPYVTLWESFGGGTFWTSCYSFKHNNLLRVNIAKFTVYVILSFPIYHVLYYAQQTNDWKIKPSHMVTVNLITHHVCPHKR